MRPSSSLSSSSPRSRTPQPPTPRSDMDSFRRQPSNESIGGQRHQHFSSLGYELHDSCLPGPDIHVNPLPQSPIAGTDGGTYRSGDDAHGDVFLPSLPAIYAALKPKHAPSPPLRGGLSSPSLASLSRKLEQMFPHDDVDGSEILHSPLGSRLPPINSYHASPTSKLAYNPVASAYSSVPNSPSHMLPARYGYSLVNLESFRTSHFANLVLTTRR